MYLQCQIWNANGTILYNNTDEFSTFARGKAKLYTVPEIEQGNTNFIVIVSVSNFN